MVTAPPVATTLIEESIVRSVANVLDVMLHRPSRLAEITPAPPRPAAAGELVIGSVGFVGDINGVVYLCIPEDFAVAIASQMLGLSPAEIAAEGPGVVKDVIGELTNMTAGGFKNALCDRGFPCKLTLPTIVRGHHLSIAAIKSAHRQIFHFDSAGAGLAADIQMMPT